MDVIGLVLLLVLTACVPATLVAWVLVNKMQSMLGEGSFWETLGDLFLRDAPGLIRSVSEVSQRIELRLHSQAVTIEGRATAVQAVTIRAHPQDCDRMAASLDVPHLLRTYGQGYLRNAVSQGWQVIAAQVTITLVADDRRRRGWPRVLAGRALAGDHVVAAASVTLSGDQRPDVSAGVDDGPTTAQSLFDPGRTGPYQPPTLQVDAQGLFDPGQTLPYQPQTLGQPDPTIDDGPSEHGDSCPSEHPTTLVEDGGQIVRLGELAVLGRSHAAQVRTNDPAVSREHAQVVHTEDGWSIEPLSHNATRVDDLACTTRTHLRSGAVIELSGRVRWTFTTGCPLTPRDPAT